MTAFSIKIQQLPYRKFILILFCFFIFLSSLFRFPTFIFDFFSNDEAAHFMGATVIGNGGTLYRDFVDNKPPIVYLLYLLSRILISDNIFSIHLITTLLIVPLISLFISLFILKINRLASIFAGSFYIIFSSVYIPTDFMSTNCEIPMLFFSSIAFSFLSVINIWSFLMFGLFTGLAALAKQQASIWLIVPTVFLLLNTGEHRLRKIIYLTTSVFIGFAIPIIITLIYFDSKGVFNEFIYFNITHNISYIKNPITTYEVIKRILKYLLPFLLIVSPLFYFYKRGRRDIPKDKRQIIEITLILSIIPVISGFRFFPHYFLQMLLPLSILSAFYPVYLILNGTKIRSFFVYVLILMIGFNSYTLFFYSQNTYFIEETLPEFREIPQELSQMGKNNGKVFVWGYAPLFYYYFYLHCKMMPASRFILPQASITGYIPGNESSYQSNLNSQKYIVEEHRELLIQDLKRGLPQIIIDTSPNGFHHFNIYPLESFKELKKLVDENYILLKNKNGFHIYLRR